MKIVKRVVLFVLVAANAAHLAYHSGSAVRWMLAQEDLASATYRNFSFRNTNDGPLHDGFGTAYSGSLGLGVAAGQVALVAAGLVLFLAGRGALKRAGWAVLVGLSAMWAINLIYFASLAGFESMWKSVGLHMAGLVVTLIAYPRFLATKEAKEFSLQGS